MGDDHRVDDQPRERLNLVRSPSLEHNAIGRYLTTSSAKRKKVKESHCQFCVRILSGGDLLDHLKKEKLCQILYYRIMRTKSFENLVLKIFSCEFCFLTKRIDFKQHLSENGNCLEHYKIKLNANTIEGVVKKVKALKRTNMPSRTTVARALQYGKEKKKKKDAKTVACSLNDYRSSIELANYKLCILCKSNCGVAREVRAHEDLYEREGLDSPCKRVLRRFEKFFVCSSCDKESEEPKDAERLVTLSEISDGQIKVFYPPTASSAETDVQNIAETNIENVSETNIENVSETNIENVSETNIRLMFPINCDATDVIPELHKVQSRSNVVRKIYETACLTTSNMSAIYENEIFKYKQRKQSGDRFIAVIKDFESKILSSVKKSTEDFRIIGSSGWVSQQLEEMRHRQVQFGSYFVTLNLGLPQNSIEIIATALIQEGFVVSTDKKGLPNGEFEVSYNVHMDHFADDDCSNNCVNKMDVKEFVEKELFDVSSLGNKHIGTYVFSVHQKLMSFQNIVQAPASELFSENFHLMLVFDLNGLASILGCIWPVELETINLELAENMGKLEKKSDLIEFIERNVSVSSDERVLRSTFHLSEIEAKRLSDLVKEFQFHLCEERNCQTCSSTELPSLETIVKDSCSKTNLEAAGKMKILMSFQLKSLSVQLKKTMSTFDWLDKVWETVSGEISDDREYLIVSFESEEDIVFEIDDGLTSYLDEYSESPLTGVYHYALSHTSKSDESQIVLKRLRILDCYNKSFNPLILKACSSPVSVTVDNNFQPFEKVLYKHRKCNLPEQITDPKLIFSHRLTSLAEALSLGDKTKKRIKGSTVVQFVNAKCNRRVMVKKVKNEGHDSFKLDGSEEVFEIVPNAITRHFSKLNGAGMLLAETVLWFDYMGSEKSRELSKMYQNEEVPKSDIKLAGSSGTLPDYLLISNGDVLKRRQNPKIMMYPKPKTSHELMYGRCLLFLPILSEDELKGPNLEEKFLRQHEEERGTVVDNNEQKLFKFKVSDSGVKIIGDGENHDDANEMAGEEFDYEEGRTALDFLIEELEDDSNPEVNNGDDLG